MSTEISFALAPSGTLPLYAASTHLSAIPAVLALDATARIAHNGYQYATDAEGLRMAASAGHAAAGTLAGGIAIFGRLLALADDEWLTSDDRYTAGTTLAGMAELARLVNSATAGFVGASAQAVHTNSGRHE